MRDRRHQGGRFGNHDEIRWPPHLPKAICSRLALFLVGDSSDAYAPTVSAPGPHQRTDSHDDRSEAALGVRRPSSVHHAVDDFRAVRIMGPSAAGRYDVDMGVEDEMWSGSASIEMAYDIRPSGFRIVVDRGGKAGASHY